MSETLEIAVRQTRGKLRNRRMRQSGQLPGILYGHGQEPISVTIPLEQMESTLRHGAQVVDLKGAADGQALLQEIQWDTYQQHVLHVDLLRVDASDRVVVEVPLALRGEAPGQRQGGVVDLLVHVVEIETSPAAIPDHLHLNVNQLQLNGELKVADIEDLPAEAKVLLDPETTLVECRQPVEMPEAEEEVAAVGGEEPEVIGRKEEEEGEADED
jgi:large subunit ribosomal protein L25